jgi:hypothetical protein
MFFKKDKTVSSTFTSNTISDERLNEIKRMAVHGLDGMLARMDNLGYIVAVIDAVEHCEALFKKRNELGLEYTKYCIANIKIESFDIFLETLDSPGAVELSQRERSIINLMIKSYKTGAESQILFYRLCILEKEEIISDEQTDREATMLAEQIKQAHKSIIELSESGFTFKWLNELLLSRSKDY